MSVYDALALMLQFRALIIAFMAVVVALILAFRRK